MTSKFCAVPWNEIYLTSNGSYGGCCMEDQNAIQSRIPISQPLQNHWNGDYIKNMRQEFIAGQDLPQCRHCWHDESAGKISGRMRRNQQYYGKGNIDIDDSIIASTLGDTEQDGHYLGNVQGLVFAVGNTCQLRCIDCSPAYSRSILKDYAKLGWDINVNARRSITIDSLNKSHDNDLWQRVRDITPSVKWIRVNGGEPSISKEFIDFLHWYHAQGYGQHTLIFISTNGASLKKDFVKALQPFPGVRLEISIDGYARVDEYLRYPTKWNKKVDNIRRMIDNFQNCSFHTTVYSLNVMDLPNLLEWTDQFDIRHSLHCLTWPNHLAVEHLPDLAKSQVIAGLTEWIRDKEHYQIDDRYPRWEYRNNCLQGIVRRLTMPRDVQSWQKTLDIVQNYDSIRPFSLTDAAPIMKKIIQDYATI